MRDLTNPSLLYLKGLLFLGCGVIAGGLLVLDRPTLQSVALLGVTVWCFARAYYFAFYVIERYADPSFRYSGLGSLLLYLLRNRRVAPASADQRRQAADRGA
jgi:hypothetical protein